MLSKSRKDSYPKRNTRVPEVKEQKEVNHTKNGFERKMLIQFDEIGFCFEVSDERVWANKISDNYHASPIMMIAKTK